MNEVITIERSTLASVREALARSHGSDGWAQLSGDTRRWAAGLGEQLSRDFWIHRDDAAAEAARMLGAVAFARGNRVYIGDVCAGEADDVVRHELVHLAQMRMAACGGRVSGQKLLEAEADRISARDVAMPVSHAADPDGIYRIVPLVLAVGFGLYVLLRPGPANAPGPDTKTEPPVSPGQIVAEGAAIFVIPAGAAAMGARLGIGFFGQSVMSGAAYTTFMRGVGDLTSGQVSPPLLYLTDAAAGAAGGVIGFVVPGGYRLLNNATKFAFDELATLGYTKSQISVVKLLAEEAQRAPLDATRAQQLLLQRSYFGAVSKWYLDRRGLMMLYRGQERATTEISSPMARIRGRASSARGSFMITSGNWVTQIAR